MRVALRRHSEPLRSRPTLCTAGTHEPSATCCRLRRAGKEFEARMLVRSKVLVYKYPRAGFDTDESQEQSVHTIDSPRIAMAKVAQ